MQQPGPIYLRMQKKLSALDPKILDIQDDSPAHQGHAAMKGISSKETHFRITVVSDQFEQLSLVKRHRKVYELLDEEMKDGGVHALQMVTKTVAEYEK